MGTIESRLSTANLYEIGRKYGFPSFSILAVPRECDRVCWPLVGFVSVYEDSLISSLRVPFPSLYADIQEKYGISAAQQFPNGVL